jgi:tRNA (guanine-N7-)-methyltransferase
LTEQLDNLQILRGDALNINYFFAPHSIDHLYLNFSDPWPKARHEKRRLTYRAFLERYQAVLKSAGELEFKTDNAGLFAYSLQSFNNYGMIFDFVSVDLHHEAEEILNKNIETEYEHKFAERGNPIYAVHAHFVEE